MLFAYIKKMILAKLFRVMNFKIETYCFHGCLSLVTNIRFFSQLY